ncbi:hypothetical protein GZH47_13615 [Paenibacillus rhizovicinus]|uniref:Intracellular proteinase inhibitor BsuPI domain-containing protein n=1 Tax=Paenibacillus rhizovicinus TaxID=2704463 RepID=A0A6C0NZV3_9BACL|nr:hypothetical protein [Paenibacillus rhizovicinus]QHW31774.1 hypothetical protein GZH47_13615 [Paenibacillus rhizovicinus]
MRILTTMLVLAFSVLLVVSGCSESDAAAGLQGSVKVDDAKGQDTKVTYVFVNRSKETITVVGGARYTLERDHETYKAGSVPVKDYIDLHPGEIYSDSVTFADLPAGSYTITVEWDNIKAVAEFSRN